MIEDVGNKSNPYQNLTCQRTMVFKDEEYKQAMIEYNRQMSKYENMSWFRRLFTSKPQCPNPQNFYVY